jgi:hypothetical protein
MIENTQYSVILAMLQQARYSIQTCICQTLI